MKLFIITSKSSYGRIPSLLTELESLGHSITLPNSYNDPEMENRIRMNPTEHAEWKAGMFRHSAKVIVEQDAVLVLNFDKNGLKNYIGGATFLEMYEAFRLGKKIFLYNPVPDGPLRDEIIGFCPTVVNGDLTNITD